MANIKSAKKRIRVIEVKTQRNKRVKGHIREILKGFYDAIAAGDKEAARDRLALAEKKLLQAGAKGTIHKNAASRKVSRITTLFVKTFGSDALLTKANPPVIATPEEKAARKAEREAARAAAHERKHRAPKSKLAKENEISSAPIEDAVIAEESAEEVQASEAVTSDDIASETEVTETAAEEDSAPSEDVETSAAEESSTEETTEQA